jgi:transcriptional regulator with XRE-family HTH domain
MVHGCGLIPAMPKSIHDDDYQIFLRLLRATRIARGVTQVELAELLGETQTFVSKCERGERRIDLLELRRFCNAMGEPFAKFTKRLDQELAS